jgi:hypothetical protein
MQYEIHLPINTLAFLLWRPGMRYPPVADSVWFVPSFHVRRRATGRATNGIPHSGHAFGWIFERPQPRWRRECVSVRCSVCSGTYFVCDAWAQTYSSIPVCSVVYCTVQQPAVFGSPGAPDNGESLCWSSAADRRIRDAGRKCHPNTCSGLMLA